MMGVLAVGQDDLFVHWNEGAEIFLALLQICNCEMKRL